MHKASSGGHIHQPVFPVGSDGPPALPARPEETGTNARNRYPVPGTALLTQEVALTAQTLTKQQVAKRLIQAAVAMFNANADPLAMHLVASSALNLLRELSKVDGERFVERVFRSALYNGAVKKLNGEETGVPDHPVVNEWIEGLTKAIESGGVKSADDITINDAGKLEVDSLKYLVDPFNFLKHADKDPDGTLDEADVRPVEATCFAVTAYGFLFPEDTVNEEIAGFLTKHGVI